MAQFLIGAGLVFYDVPAQWAKPNHNFLSKKSRSAPMKRVVAVIQPFKLEEVENALLKAGISGINMTDAMGFGQQKEPAEVYLDADQTEHFVRFVPKTKVEVVVPDSLVDMVVAAIAGSARTGQVGDGKIFVASINGVMRIRTGDLDDAAL
jgi:nitrogen regulatory protein PII